VTGLWFLPKLAKGLNNNNNNNNNNNQPLKVLFYLNTSENKSAVMEKNGEQLD